MMTQFDYSLLAPGPVNLHPEVQKILSLPMIHHRTPQFDQILQRVFKNLKIVFQTEQAVLIHTSTGSGGMESLIVNTLSAGDKVIVVDSGKFGERWVEMAKRFGLEVITHKIPWGHAVQIEDVEKLLRQHPNAKAFLTQACETSTATMHPIQEIGKLIHEKFSQVLFLVDGITAAGAVPMPFDEWHLDGLVAGSQKAFMLPTGLSFVCFSKKAWQAIDQSTMPKFYFDIKAELKANQKGETLFSTAVPHIRALDKVLELILEKGLNHLHQQIHKRAQFTRSFAQKMGFQLYSKKPSDSVTALVVPQHVDSQKMRTHLEEHWNITIMGGQDEAKGKILRMGHMGYIQKHELKNLLYALAMTLKHFDPASDCVDRFKKLEAEMDQQLLELTND